MDEKSYGERVHLRSIGPLVVCFICLAFFNSNCERNQPETLASQYVNIGSLPKQLKIDLPALPTGAVPLSFILIDSGVFTMGSPPNEIGRSENDWPPHRVTISTPFYLAQFEMTQAQWETLMEKNPSYFSGHPDFPVEKVTWRDCQQFIKKLNSLGKGTFRLPTEAEWEYACRAGTTSRFYFGEAAGCADSPDCPIADEYMWWAGNNDPEGPKKVGQKKPNAWDLYDMHGNVYEWCADRWQAPNNRGPQIDPVGPRRSAKFLLIFTNRTARGGCFQHGGLNHCRSAYRFYEQSTDHYYGLGFRLVREVDGQEKQGGI